jgi:hypothetical protein
MLALTIWLLSLYAFVHCYNNRKIYKKKSIDINFDDYKEKELGNINLPNDHKEL